MTPALFDVPGTLVASLILQVTRPVDSGPSAADWLPALIPVVAFGALFAWNQPRRLREAPLRREMRAKPSTFKAGLFDVQAIFLGMWASVKGGPFLLTVHGDVVGVSSLLPPARFVFGYQWCYQARDTTMKIVPGRRHELIEIAGLPTAVRPTSKAAVLGEALGNLGGPIGEVVAAFRSLSPVSPALIRIGNKRMTREIWDALARAGVHPVGAPPQ
jgi:hypothetical protein